MHINEFENAAVEIINEAQAGAPAKVRTDAPTPLERFLKLRDSRPDAPRLSVESVPDQPLEVMQVDDAGRPVGNAGLALAFGTTEEGVASALLGHLINAAVAGSFDDPPSEKDINEALAMVHGIGARDEVEGMLAVQMVGTHYAATRALRRLKGSGMRDNDGNIATKFLRTFAAQIGALQRYRGKGQQKMTIEHVHIHKGGQAIVGSVGR